ncbi:hypothetical protein DPMN_041767 [Dreissena polymorpha]|uniref:Uncharacterized protein n=1 Tax=Dreissena polymorpha TaxID=45954 RepID=A0A9D4CXV0_DREPO|nr:hypothetical protein DPMN_041767 [Dreissena polymorpha]
MKATLAIFGLALFAILAECKPAEEPAQNLLKKQLGNNLEAAGKAPLIFLFIFIKRYADVSLLSSL